MKIAIFYHCFFCRPDLRPEACAVVYEQMNALECSGLLSQAEEFTVGINGGEESMDSARLFIPNCARKVFHGLDSKNENLTLMQLELWAPSHQDWFVLYFHAKGSSFEPSNPYGQLAARWRHCMTHHLILNWQQCVSDLGCHEAVGCHWQRGIDDTQHYFAGNFFWCRASFFSTIPSMMQRECIRRYGVKSTEARYEAEVVIGNGPRLPVVRDYAKHRAGGCP